MANKTLEQTIEFMQTISVVDGHCDAVLQSKEKKDYLLNRDEERHIDAPRLKESGITALFFACWVHPDRTEGSYTEETYDLLDELHSISEHRNTPFRIARTAEDVRRHQKKGIYSIIPCVEGGHAIKNNLRHLRNFARLGVKYMTLTWMNNNEWADGSGDQRTHGGLSDRGKAVVREMNRRGIIVDVSHTSEETFYDALDTSEKPVIASHSCCREICNHHRNLNDDQLRTLAKNDGVIGICFYPGYLDETYRTELEHYENERDTDEWIGRLPEERRPQVGIHQIVDHVEHAVDVAGIDHVALGSDFDGVAALPEGIKNCSDYPRIIKALFDHGFNETDVRKIAGGNFLRIMKETERDGT